MKNQDIRPILMGAALLIGLMMNVDALAQGCVAVRSFSGCSGSGGATGATLAKGDFMLGSTYRYFKSFRHFRGDHEETHRIDEGTQVINKSHFLDLSVSYGISDRLFATAVVPFVDHSRSSMYEHGGNPPKGLGERHTTKANGLSDIRLSMGWWIFKQNNARGNNLSVSLGVKAPTGSFSSTDLFYNQGDLKNEDKDAVVDQSIQPGDGGWGITFETNMYQLLSEKLMLTTNMYYMSNPATTNGQLTRSGSSEFSCVDQYAARLGLFWASPIKRLSIYGGGRIEGIPANDIIGSSEGYRRPGYAVSGEPGINYDLHNVSLNISVPLAVYRNRIRSYQDIERTEKTGVYRHGDAAFADYLINFTLFWKISSKKTEDSEMPHNM